MRPFDENEKLYARFINERDHGLLHEHGLAAPPRDHFVIHPVTSCRVDNAAVSIWNQLTPGSTPGLTVLCHSHGELTIVPTLDEAYAMFNEPHQFCEGCRQNATPLDEQIFDEEGERIYIGAMIVDGNDHAGVVTDLVEADDSHLPRVEVLWFAIGPNEREQFDTGHRVRNYNDRGYVCDELTIDPGYHRLPHPPAGR